MKGLSFRDYYATLGAAFALTAFPGAIAGFTVLVSALPALAGLAVFAGLPAVDRI